MLERPFPLLFSLVLQLITHQTTQAAPLTNWSCSSSQLGKEPQIINGVKSRPGQWPFMAALLYKKKTQWCGGSIINDDTILTAAHCLKQAKLKPSDIAVIIGENKLNTRIVSRNNYSVRSFKITKEFDMTNLEKGHDVAIIKLAKKIRFGGSIYKVCLADTDAVPIEEKCIVMGWGETKSGKKSAQLQHGMVPIIPPKKCKETGGHDYDEKQLICAGDLKKHTDACGGDSGGPLICPHPGNKKEYLQFGIVSFGYGCGVGGGYYADVRPHLKWIKKLAEG